MPLSLGGVHAGAGVRVCSGAHGQGLGAGDDVLSPTPRSRFTLLTTVPDSFPLTGTPMPRARVKWTGWILLLDSRFWSDCSETNLLKLPHCSRTIPLALALFMVQLG